MAPVWQPALSTGPERGTQIVAKTLFRELRKNGWGPTQIVALSTALIDLVTCDLQSESGASSREEA